MRAPAASLVVISLAVVGCGHSTPGSVTARTVTVTARAAAAAPAVTAVSAATARIPADDPVALAAAVAVLTHPSAPPRRLVLADRADWRATLQAAFLGDPLLLTAGGRVPRATARAIVRLRPSGAVLTLDGAPAPRGVRAQAVRSGDPYALAAALLRLAGGSVPTQVMVVSADRPRFATIAAGLSAATRTPIVLSPQDGLPDATRQYLRALHRPHIYIVGPDAAIGPHVEDQLRTLGPVTRIAGRNPVGNAVAFARYTSPTFGWGASAPGRGLLIASADADPQVGPATAALAASGGGGPLLLLGDPGQLDATVDSYLAAIAPPPRGATGAGPYNHAWIVGGTDAVSSALQSLIDRLMEIPSR